MQRNRYRKRIGQLFLLMCVLLLSRAARGEHQCPYIVLLNGDEAAIAEVGQQLLALEIQTASSPGCPAAEATVERREGRYTLTIETPTTPYVREVRGAETVAVLIDAWVHSNSENLLNAGEVPAVQEAPVVEQKTLEKQPVDGKSDGSVSPAEKTDSPTPFSAPTKPRTLQMQLLFESMYGFDKSLWMGPMLALCAFFGPVCVGAEIRYAGDTELVGDNAKNRILLDGAILAYFRTIWRRLHVCFGVSLGGGYYATWYENGTPLGQHGGLRVGAFASLAVRITERFSVVFLDLSYALSVPVHEDRYTDNLATDESVIVEPRGFARGGIGIKYDILQ